jgi:predicted ATPase
MIEAVRRYGGYIVQSTGDGVFALFGAPEAHEDHPQRALYAALRMQEELRRYSDTLLADGRAPLEIRVGVNTGEVVVRSISTGGGHVEYTPIGHTTNLASRMQTIAPTGSIAITEHTRQLVEGYFALKARGPTRIKGVSEPVKVYEVTGLGPLRTRLQRSAGRGLTKFVGREREMEAMRNAAEQARTGHGQIVAAMAEAGTGKSRLFFEFKAKHQADWMVLETFSVSHGKASSYLPLIELLHGYFGIDSGDDARKRREKANGRILTLDRSLEDTLPYLFGLLGIVEDDDPLAQMDAQVRKRRTLDAIKRIVLRESMNQPLMVIFEDLHWIDEETQELLNLLADSIGTAKILLLVNYRPEYSHQWSNKSYYTQLRLDPLGGESADEMLTAMVGDGAEVRPLKHLIIERTEGNPFFMEETVQVLLDEGALVRDGVAVRLTKALGDLKIPPTVQAILAARIDRLPANEKDLLQMLAVMGKEFHLSLVRALTVNSDEEPGHMLDGLERGEFIYEQPAIGDVAYTFKHALTQEVAYNSILSDRRKLLHERIARTIETVCAANIDDHVFELAHHYRRSGNADKAVEYLRLAGEQALQRSALIQALDNLNAAVELVRKRPESAERNELELVLQITLGSALTTKSWGSPEKLETFERARELCARVGDRADVFPVLFHLGEGYISLGRLAQARNLGTQCIELAEHLGQKNLLIGAHHLSAEALFWLGDFSQSRAHLEQATGLYDPAQHQPLMMLYGMDPWVLSAGMLAMSLQRLGRFDASRVLAERVACEAQRISHPFTLAFGMMLAALTAIDLREVKKTAEWSRAAVAVSVKHGFLETLSSAKWLDGWATVQQGQAQAGIAAMIESLDECLSAGSTPIETWTPAIMAEILAAVGRMDEAFDQLKRARNRAQETGEHHFDAEVCRIGGNLLQRRDGNAGDAAAERCFREAIGIARNQSAKSWELRATTSLARLLRDTNRRDEARAMLTDIYNWFTEGFDTADLKDAKTLLDELSGYR